MMMALARTTGALLLLRAVSRNAAVGVMRGVNTTSAALSSSVASRVSVRQVCGTSSCRFAGLPAMANMAAFTMSRQFASNTTTLLGRHFTTASATTTAAARAPLMSLLMQARQPAVSSPSALVQQVRGVKTMKRQIKRHYRQKTKYKMKTKKAVASRFKLTKSGLIKYWRRGRVHNSQAKSKKTHRQLRKAKVLRSGTMFKKLRRAMQY